MQSFFIIKFDNAHCAMPVAAVPYITTDMCIIMCCIIPYRAPINQDFWLSGRYPVIGRPVRFPYVCVGTHHGVCTGVRASENGAAFVVRVVFPWARAQLSGATAQFHDMMKNPTHTPCGTLPPTLPHLFFNHHPLCTLSRSRLKYLREKWIFLSFFLPLTPIFALAFVARNKTNKVKI